MNTQYVVFAPKAFNAIVTETLDKHPAETGKRITQLLEKNCITIRFFTSGCRTWHGLQHRMRKGRRAKGLP